MQPFSFFFVLLYKAPNIPFSLHFPKYISTQTNVPIWSNSHSLIRVLERNIYIYTYSFNFCAVCLVQPLQELTKVLYIYRVREVTEESEHTWQFLHGTAHARSYACSLSICHPTTISLFYFILFYFLIFWYIKTDCCSNLTLYTYIYIGLCLSKSRCGLICSACVCVCEYVCYT